MIELRPLTADEFAAWLPGEIKAYAETKVRSGQWSEEEADGLSAKQMAEVLPLGLDTPHHELYSVVSGDRTVGHLWIAIRAEEHIPSAYIYNIAMAASERGRGHGRATIAALEERLRTRGIKKLQLNVFGYNTEAKRLYDRLGFVATSILMTKEL